MADPNPDPVEVGNALSELFSLETRKKIYAVFVLLGLAAGVVAISFTASGTDVPKWVLVMTAVYNFLNGFVSLIARVNAGKPGLT